MDIVDHKPTTLRAIGKDESWLKDWIIAKPSRLGLGNLKIAKSELIHYKNKGGRLDILAYQGDIDTYYEIEIMLGECDSDHGFRALDYWAREKVSHPDSRHVAVLIAEDLSGRYKTIIETLPQYLPFIGIELKVFLIPGQHELAIILPSIIAQPDDLFIRTGDEPVNESEEESSVRDRQWWEQNKNISDIYIQTVNELTRYCIDNIGPSQIDYSAQSYISLKKGRRCWLPMWPRKDGAYVYIAGGDNGTSDSPTDFYNWVKEQLQIIGIEAPTWTYKYNSGANPIAFPILKEQATHSIIREILKRAYELS